MPTNRLLLTLLHSAANTTAPRPVGRKTMWWNSVIQRLTHYYSTRLHQPHCAVLPCSTLFLPSHSPKRQKLVGSTEFHHAGGLCSEAKKCLYFIMGNLPRLTSICWNFSKCYVVNGRRTLFFSKVDKRFFGHRRTLFVKLLHKRRRTLFLAS